MDTSHHPKTADTAKTATTELDKDETKKEPAEIVFMGLCMFIVTSQYVAVALLKPLPRKADGAHGAHSASDHAAYFYEHALDRGTVGEAELLRSFPHEMGGQWIGTELKGEKPYGNPADGRPDISRLQSEQYRLPNLRTLGKQGGRRDLSITWPSFAQAVIVLYGGALEPRAPVLNDFKIDWDFREKKDVEIPADRRIFLAEQVVWKNKIGTAGTAIIANVPFETVKKKAKEGEEEREDEKQLLHFESFYQVFSENSKEPVLLPTNPSDDVEVYPIFCPPALYEV